MKISHFSIFVILFLFTNCETKTVYRDAIPEHDTFTINSKIVNEDRVINVWTPENYKISTETFPVMYMADGGIEEDFAHIANTISDLIKQKKIAPIILVGIENTDRKRDLTGFTSVEKDKEIGKEVGESEKFRNFIKDELIPEINKKYRTTNKKGIIGESLSGLFVVETLQLTPTLFDFYIAMDPALWWNDEYLVKNAKANFEKMPATNIKFWFAGSNVQKDNPFISKLNEIITKVNPQSFNWKYVDAPKEEHPTVFRATKEEAIIWALN